MQNSIIMLYDIANLAIRYMVVVCLCELSVIGFNKFIK